MNADTRTEAEIRYDATALSRPRESALDAELAANVVTMPVWRDTNGNLSWDAGTSIACFDYAIGEGLTKVVIGAHAGDKPGVEIIIGGSCINESLTDILSLADVRQLRDNLTAILAALIGRNCEQCGADLQLVDDAQCSKCRLLGRLEAYAQMPGADLARLAERLMV